MSSKRIESLPHPAGGNTGGPHGQEDETDDEENGRQEGRQEKADAVRQEDEGEEVTYMKWLVACERSGIVRDALRAAGHEAFSCDLFPSRRPSPYHLQCDVCTILHYPWDGLIAHPVCKYMANSGVRWLHERPERWALMEEGVRFFNIFRDAVHIPRRAIENPVLHGYALELIGRPADQYVHPWWFGDPFQKATGLWLYGLPKLKATHKRSDYPEIKQEVWLMPPGPDREEKRSETKPAMARAMATQWSSSI